MRKTNGSPYQAASDFGVSERLKVDRAARAVRQR